MRVDLIYDLDCPNVPAARTALVRAFVAAGMAPSWREHCSADGLVLELDGFGSPTILVDGRDVMGEAPSGGPCCRLYPGGAVAPPPDAIVAALRSSSLGVAPNAANAANEPAPIATVSTGSRPSFPRVAAALPGLAVALLPKVACPACWPLYAGLLGSIGLGFLVRTEILLPITIAFFAATLASFAFGARKRRGFGPLALGAVAAAGLLVGKFVFELEPAVQAGVALLVVASLWNAWPRRTVEKSCNACIPSTTEGASS
jgi:mercuric ion transport protein